MSRSLTGAAAFVARPRVATRATAPPPGRGTTGTAQLPACPPGLSGLCFPSTQVCCAESHSAHHAASGSPAR
eukprot:2369167-Prymnesium_polylepis.1